MAHDRAATVRLPAASTPVGVASAASLAMQLLLGMLLLHVFSPAAVGDYAVIAQVAFYWTALALAQGQLRLLADHGRPPRAALRENLLGALGRWAILFPVGWLAMRWSDASLPGALAWATLLALLQVGWGLAQPFTLRAGARSGMAWVRIAPPALTLSIIVLVMVFWPGAGAQALLLAAAIGYAVGCAWLFTGTEDQFGSAVAAQGAPRTDQGDDRSQGLRLLHTAADAVIGTAVLLVWRRTYGSVEAGYLAVLLRILGFVPAVIHAAWAQVLLALGSHRHMASFAAAACGIAVTSLLGLACSAALRLGWIGPSWQGVGPYVVPVVCWQASACIFAAFSHLPFQRQRASAFSTIAIGYDLLQFAILGLPVLLALEWGPRAHIAAVAYGSSIGLIGMSIWLARGASARR